MEPIPLGKLAKPDAGRDAVHIACAPTVAPCDLKTGDLVDAAGNPADWDDAVGIVDPFLRSQVVNKGERFYVCLFPNTVTGLRHEWTHPAYPDVPAPEVRETIAKYLREKGTAR